MKTGIDLKSLPQVLYLQRGQLPPNTINRYNSPEIWAVHLFFDRFHLRIGNESREIRPGMLTVTPPGTPSVYRIGDSKISYLCLHIKSREESGKSYVYNYFYDTGLFFHEASGIFSEAIDIMPLAPERASAKCLDLLLLIRNLDNNPHRTMHPALVKAISIIESDPSDHKNVAELAELCEISSSQLNRLFRERFSKSPAQYMRDKSMERAMHLLSYGNRTVRSIAYELGYEDLQAFNKLCHRYFGKSPRKLRLQFI